MPNVGDISGNARWNGESWERVGAPAQQPAGGGYSPSFFQNVTAQAPGGPLSEVDNPRFSNFATQPTASEMQNLLRLNGIDGELVTTGNSGGTQTSSPMYGLRINGNVLNAGQLANRLQNNGLDHFLRMTRDELAGLGMGGSDNAGVNVVTPGLSSQDTGRAVSRYTAIPADNKGAYGGVMPGYNPATRTPAPTWGSPSSSPSPSSGSISGSIGSGIGGGFNQPGPQPSPSGGGSQESPRSTMPRYETPASRAGSFGVYSQGRRAGYGGAAASALSRPRMSSYR